MKLLFNKVDHTYTLNGKSIPNVTTILETVGLSDFSKVNRELLRIAQERGTAVHLATEYMDTVGLDMNSIDPELAGYIEAWAEFKNDFKPLFSEVELKVYDEKLWYCGTLDRVARINNKTVLIDIKTGAHSKSHGIQLSAYESAYGDVDERWIVRLDADGKYNVKPYKNIMDKHVFISALTLYKFIKG